ncbi:MAG: hypothetical protein JWN34_4886 [Bryobacterales bacterium]|nr:hypothetical protein [Bryobacterales bacterium]
MRVAIIADDLTGACDAAVHFQCVGLATEVRLGQAIPESAVVAFSTDSRDLPGEEIRRRIRAVANVVRPEVAFKKIDSVLRGRPGFEISVALDAFGCELAVITPAYPELGRVVCGGLLQLPEPLDVAAKLAADGLDLGKCLILDAATNEDLDAIVRRDHAAKVLWCGSGGLALALARQMGISSRAAPNPPRGPVTFCIGSTHPVTLAQLESLAARCGGNRLVEIDRNRTTAAEIRELLAGPRPAALFICGGDTATMVLSALGTESISLQGEVVRGVPWGILRHGIMDSVAVVTKSGGFGAPDTLLRVAAMFNET